MMLVVDLHAHLVPPAFPALPGGVSPGGWPTMVPLEDGRSRMVIDGRDFRVIERPYFDLEARLALMDRQGVALQVVSPLPELLSYWLAADTATEVSRLTNRTIASAVRAARGRLEGLGMLPLQDVERSLAMIPELAELGLRGIEVGSNVDGRSIAGAAFDPVFAELARRGMAVMVHGSRPPAPERLLGPPLMGNVIGIPQEGASALASFIASDVLAKHPDLRLCFVHGGGAFGSLLDRMDYVWREHPAVRSVSATSPRDYVRKFFFDTVTYSVPYLRYLMDAFGIETLACGTDGPSEAGGEWLEAFILEACRGDEAAAEQILWKNAARFLGLDGVAGRAIEAG
jgi:aminocarboxymuconate-semialdehyde decarboxylase